MFLFAQLEDNGCEKVKSTGFLRLSYKRLKGRVPLTQCAEWVAKGVNLRETFSAAKKWSLLPEKLMRYLERNVGCARYGGMASLGSALQYWKDYLTAAEAMGYQLHRDNVLLPEPLGAAHDSATATHQKKLEREWKMAQAEQDRLMAMAYEERRAELEKKYGFVMGGCVIRVPAGKNEILEEGRKLKHCVGGYADRHMRGAVTILFMRKVKKPNEPYVTIEMRGNKIMQIHGYRNDIGGENPRTQHKEFLAAWLNWLKRGSPQDKQGNPKLPRKEKGAAA